MTLRRPLVILGNGARGELPAADRIPISSIERPLGYVDGLRPVWNDLLDITVTAGACHIQSSDKVLRAVNDISLSGLALPPSAWSHLYGYESGGALAIEVSSTDPAAPYSGSARSKTGDTTRRYLGSILTRSNSNLYKFVQCGDWLMWEVSVDPAPFLVVGPGRATTATNVSCLGAVPPTTKMAKIIMAMVGTGASAVVGNSDLQNPLGTGNYLQFLAGGVQATHDTLLDTQQRLNYLLTATVTSGGFYARVIGYLVDR